MKNIRVILWFGEKRQASNRVGQFENPHLLEVEHRRGNITNILHLVPINKNSQGKVAVHNCRLCYKDSERDYLGKRKKIS
jgi:hypothetical protein